MKFAILGSGAVGGYYGARLARSGHDVTFIARGAHLVAIRADGLQMRSPALGDFAVRAPAEPDTSLVGRVDVVLFAVKTYDNDSAIPALRPLVGPASCVLTLQNGVDSVTELAAAVGAEHVIGGTTYIATALAAPGVIEQTGTHRGARVLRAQPRPRGQVGAGGMPKRCSRRSTHASPGRRPREGCRPCPSPTRAARVRRRAAQQPSRAAERAGSSPVVTTRSLTAPVAVGNNPTSTSPSNNESAMHRS